MRCPKCQSRVSENATFCGECGAPLKDGAVEPPENFVETRTYLTQAILVTIFCCIPGGIVAIIYACNASSYFAVQDYYSAQAEAAKAKSWCIWSLVIGIIARIVNILILAIEKYN